ncbi:MAG TPA: helix-turn-helix domain-containing protein [Thermoanaerobaculia bacterium]|nr:helix-turn-helix domain-containing protein [Thermoanaerobaculia bacterium]
MQRLSGSELRSRRIRLGLSRERLAHAVGVPITTVTEWEEDAVPIACPHAVEQVLRQEEVHSTARLPRAS